MRSRSYARKTHCSDCCDTTLEIRLRMPKESMHFYRSKNTDPNKFLILSCVARILKHFYNKLYFFFGILRIFYKFYLEKKIFILIVTEGYREINSYVSIQSLQDDMRTFHIRKAIVSHRLQLQ